MNKISIPFFSSPLLQGHFNPFSTFYDKFRNLNLFVNVVNVGGKNEEENFNPLHSVHNLFLINNKTVKVRKGERKKKKKRKGKGKAMNNAIKSSTCNDIIIGL